MPFYECRAMDRDGEMVRRIVEADGPGGAAAEIRSLGLNLIAVEETEQGGGLADFSPGRWLPVATKDKILLFRMLATLVKSEVTVTEALRVLREQADRANLRAVLADVSSRVDSGMPLSEALAHHPRVFPAIMVNMIRAGEMGGILDTVFFRVADLLERRATLRKRLLMAFFYPGMVLLVGVAVIVFMVLVVIPRFMGLIQGRLPPATQLLMDITEFFQQRGGELLLGTGLGLGVLVLLHALPFTRYYLDRHRMKLPVVGPVIRLGVVVAFARTFGVLLESRIPMVEALRATAGTIPNAAVSRLLEEMTDRVMAGEPLSATLRDSWAFTPLTRSLAGIGEHSGLMSDAMITVAEVHEKLLEDKVAKMSAMVEPALIVTLGATVGFVVYALISGMLAMYGAAM